MEVWDFIDSPDVREECRKHTFSPAEQAVLCMRSNLRSLDEKMSFLASLLEAHPEAPYPFEGDGGYETDIKTRMQEVVHVWKHYHPVTGRVDPSDVFVAHIRYLGDRKAFDFGGAIFRTFEKARAYLQRVRYRLMKIEEDEETVAAITQERIDVPGKRVRYQLNDALEIIDASSIGRRCYELDVPVPFQRGDILFAEAERDECVRYAWEAGFYCVAADRWMENGTLMTSYVRWDKNHQLEWLTDPWFRLRLRFCKADEQPGADFVELSKAVQRGKVSCPVNQFLKFRLAEEGFPF